MANRPVNIDNDSVAGVFVYKVTDMVQGDTAGVQITQGVITRATVYSYPSQAGVYAVNIMYTPNGKAVRLSKVGQVTNLAPVIEVESLGRGFRLDAITVAGGIVDVFVVTTEGVS